MLFRGIEILLRNNWGQLTVEIVSLPLGTRRSIEGGAGGLSRKGRIGVEGAQSKGAATGIVSKDGIVLLGREKKKTRTVLRLEEATGYCLVDFKERWVSPVPVRANEVGLSAWSDVV